MKNFFYKHYIIIQGLLSFTLAILIGFYTELLSSQLSQNPQITLKVAIEALGLRNLLFIFSVLIFAFQIYLNSIPIKTIRDSKKRIIEEILEAACRSLIYPNKNLHIRAIVTLCDHKKGIRQTMYSYNTRPDPERVAIFPIDFGVTGEAYKTRTVVARQLPDDHISTYPDEVKSSVATDLKSVLALPILNPDNFRAPLLGILAFDSCEKIDTIGFNSRESFDIAQSWADLIGEVLIL
jgi:hypothetical protein